MSNLAPHETWAESVDLRTSEPRTTPRSSPSILNTPEARESQRASVAFRQQLQREDVGLLRKQGLVPLAIADQVGISLRLTMKYLEELGEEIPRYLITSGEPKRAPCLCCGKIHG